MKRRSLPTGAALMEALSAAQGRVPPSMSPNVCKGPDAAADGVRAMLEHAPKRQKPLEAPKEPKPFGEAAEEGAGYGGRPAGAKPGDTWYTLVTNTPCGTEEVMMDLVALKGVFSQQLPKMPRDYILRLMMDRTHRSLCLKRLLPDGKERIVGGICFRPFPAQDFAEIVFLAVRSDAQTRGYGHRIMNELKRHCQREGIGHFLTFADNEALGYFRKQGFSRRVSLPRTSWKGFIKEYDGGTLMEGVIYPGVDYANVRAMFASQANAVESFVAPMRTDDTVYPGLPSFRASGVVSVPIEAIPGVAEKLTAQAGTRQNRRRSSQAQVREQPRKLHPDHASSPLSLLGEKLGKVLRHVTHLKESWPFRSPVRRADVPDYHTIVKSPMDLSTIRDKLRRRMYRTVTLFKRDMEQIWINCSLYNPPESIYAACAAVCKAEFETQIKEKCGELW